MAQVVPEAILSALSFEVLYFALVIGEVKDAPLTYRPAHESLLLIDSNHPTLTTPSDFRNVCEYWQSFRLLPLVYEGGRNEVRFSPY